MTACPISFEFLNYTIITSKCKGPQYSPKLCCSALTQLVCPYVDALNDMTTDCASTIFSYINIYGKYPPGLFSSICREGAEGLACPPCPPPSHSKSASLLKRSSPSIVNASGLLLLLLSLVWHPGFVLVLIYTPRKDSQFFVVHIHGVGYGKMISLLLY